MILFRHSDLRMAALLGVLLLGMAVTVGCGDVPGDTEDTGSILKVESVSGLYLGKLTNQVDTTKGICDGSEEDDIEYEDFSDHFGQVEVTNRPLPNTDEQTASPVYIRSYTVSFVPIDHAGVTPPPLEPYRAIPLIDTRGIQPCPPNSTSCAPTKYAPLKFVDIAKKQEYLTRGGAVIDKPASYNIRYTFKGENIFGEEFTFGGGTNFTIFNYDYCD